jgi:hypothetical protein
MIGRERPVARIEGITQRYGTTATLDVVSIELTISIRAPGSPTCSPAFPIIRPSGSASCCPGIGPPPQPPDPGHHPPAVFTGCVHQGRSLIWIKNQRFRM